MKNIENDMLRPLVADHKGNIFDLEGYAAVGRIGYGNLFSRLFLDDMLPLPEGSEFMFLPDRHPVLYNLKKQKIEVVVKNPFNKKKPLFPVSVFNSPGFVVTHLSSYKENIKAKPIPLFSYGAAAFFENKFLSPAVQVEWEPRQELRLMPIAKIKSGIKTFQKKMKNNRLRKHLEKCALVYGCPAAKNFFLKRYEAPLPTSQFCNANCIGCISLQKSSPLSSCQERISFTPSPDEIAEIAVEHINNVEKAIVSFGQGCEGEPLLASDSILPAIKQIRSITKNGTINLNTNASRPDLLEKLFNAGLDSIRVSINSFQEKYYNAYFRPKSYKFIDVLKCIEIANKYEKFVSINYLNIPGFTDTPNEINACMNYLNNNTVNMIQWRNLNIDPLYYYKALKIKEKPKGIKFMLNLINNEFPKIKFGYFNPPKENF